MWIIIVRIMILWYFKIYSFIQSTNSSFKPQLLDVFSMCKTIHKGPNNKLGYLTSQWAHHHLFSSTCSNRINPGKALLRKGSRHMPWFCCLNCTEILLFSCFKGKCCLFYNVTTKIAIFLFLSFILLKL